MTGSTVVPSAVQGFDEATAATRLRLFGVDYLHLAIPPERGGGDLYVTRYGWPFFPSLLPEAWYTKRHYARAGTRLGDSSGTVYRVAPRALGSAGEGRGKTWPAKNPFYLVIKFCRIGQDVPLWVTPSMYSHIPEAAQTEARFPGPFEEFGLVEALRSARSARPRIFTKRPLAIYSPAEELLPWQSPRSESAFQHSQALQDQANGGSTLPLALTRDYLLLYSWIKGENAQYYLKAGLLSEGEFLGLIPRAAADLQAAGFRMLDLKPPHLILRTLSPTVARRVHAQHRISPLLRHRNELVYALVDYELLVPFA